MPYTILPAEGSDESVNEWIKLGTEAYALQKLPTAEKNYRRALRIDPNNPVANNNLGVILACQGQLNEALLALERAAIFDGKEPIIAANAALANFETDRMDEARAISKLALALAAELPEGDDESKRAGYIRARLAYAVISASYGKPQDALPAYSEMLAVEPNHPAAGPNACFIQTLIDLSPKELLEQRKITNEPIIWKGPYWPHRNTKHPDRLLRVGYVSGDYKSHSAAMIFANVLLNHDKENVQPYLYCTLPTEADKDDMTQKLMECGHWRDVRDKKDEEIEDLIQDDEIDILVDLAGHTNGGKMALFSRKPAPIQVSAWGFAHGTGLPQMDYFFADPIAVPEHERCHFTETIWDLPCIVTYRPPVEYGILASTPMPYKRNDYITFGSFSRFEKMSDECLAAFNEIMRRVPNSRLYLKDAAYKRPYSIRRILQAMPDVDKSRIKFGVVTSHPEHMQDMQKVDLVLDPFPHGGGNVTLETLYAGVPIITRYGKQPSGRTASSVLTVLGRKDWIAKDAEEYVEKAVEWSGRTKELSDARLTLREELVNSPIVNGYVKSVEDAYRLMWRKYCESPR